jgi:hypothetical protein
MQRANWELMARHPDSASVCISRLVGHLPLGSALQWRILALTIKLLEESLTRLFVLVALIAGTALAQTSQPSPSPPQPAAKSAPANDLDSSEGLPCPQGRHKTAQAVFGEYVIRTYRWPDPEGCLQILKRGTVVYSLTSADFRIGNNLEGGAAIPVGTDITGRGKHEAVVGEWTGGAHCCFTLHVFELAETFQEIAQIELEDSDTSHFVDLNHDGQYEIEGYDWTFAYWKASFNESPAPRIVLKYRAGRFRLALDLMRKPSPSPSKFDAMERAVEADNEWEPDAPPDCEQDCGIPVALWKNMLDLMYTGHADLAWRLLDEAWPIEKKGEAAFAKAFYKRLSSSNYWPDLKESIGPCPRIP